MAFEMKGKVSLSPDFVIVTSNNTKIEGATINHKGAFARRFLFLRLIWAGEGPKPIPGQEIDTDSWRFVVARCDKDTAWAFKEDGDAPVLTFDEVAFVMAILRRQSIEDYMKGKDFMKNDNERIDAVLQKVSEIRLEPGKKPWEYIKYQSKFAAAIAQGQIDENRFGETPSPDGFEDGAYLRHLYVDGAMCKENEMPFRKPLTEAHFTQFNEKIVRKDGRKSNQDVVDAAFNPSSIKLASSEEGPIPVSDCQFDLDFDTLAELRKCFVDDPFKIGYLMFPKTGNTKASLALGRALVTSIYKRCMLQVPDNYLETMDLLLSRGEALTWYCIVNSRDIQAARRLTSVSLTEDMRRTAQAYGAMVKENIQDVAYVAMGSLAAAAMVVASTLAMIKLATLAVGKPKRKAISPVQNKSIPQASGYVDMRTIVRLKKLNKTRPKLAEKEIVRQSSEVFLTGQRMAAHAQWQVRDSNNDVFTNMLALGGRDFVMNDHSYEILKATVDTIEPELVKELCLTCCNGDKTHEVPVTEFLKGIALKNFDTYWMRLPSMPECKDISPHWVPDGYLEGLMQDAGKFVALSSCIFGKGLATSRGTIIAGRTIEGAYRSLLWSVHEMNSNGGDCGSACFVASAGPAQGKICGILQSGEDGMGATYFCAISRFVMLQMRNKLSGYEAPARNDGKKCVIGSTPTPHNFTSIVADVLVPSEYPASEPSKAPVDIQNPAVYDMARAKYCPLFKPKQLDLERLRVCVKETLRFLRDVSPNAPKGGMKSYLEAIVGEDGTYFRGIPLATSPGAPYNLGNPVPKRDLLGFFEDGTFHYGSRSQEMMDIVGKNLEHLLKGEVPLDMFTDIVKSELLPAAKVAKGKGRIISSCPIARTIVARMIYGNFMAWLAENHLRNGISIGDNMQGTDADIVVRQHISMAAHEDLHLAGDLSANDARQTPECLTMIGEEINSAMVAWGCMDTVQYRMAETFSKSYHTQFHTRGDLIDMWEGSLSSGDPHTSVYNSLLNPAYTRYSIWKECGFPGGDWHEQYAKNIKANYLGDDNWITVSPAWKQFVSEKVMQDGYADFGHVYTNDAKDGINDDMRSIENITFLKRRPRFEPVLGKWLMCLELSSLIDIGLWTTRDGKKGGANILQALMNVDTMTRELCFHDDDTWNQWIPRFITMYQEYGWSPKYLNRIDMLKTVFGQDQSLCF